MDFIKKLCVFSAIPVVFVLFSCNDKPVEQDRCDKKAMLENYADRLIVPAFEKVHASVSEFKNLWAGFEANPAAGAIAGLQDQWTVSYRAWQYANAFNFGPAGETGLKMSLVGEIGKFPALIGEIESRIAAGDFSTDNPHRNTRGFMALEYLLFHQGDLLVSDENRRHYAGAVLLHLEAGLAAVNLGWKTYKSQFLSELGTEAGSSMSLLYNEFLRSFEDLKNLKIGAPSGITNFFMIPLPETVEAYYSGQSLAFLKLHLQALENIYEGHAPDGSDGFGLKDYLECVEGGPALISATENSLKDIHSALDAVPVDLPLSTLMAQNDVSVHLLYDALKNHVRFFGSDMSSVMGIAITFDSGDGD